MPGEITVTAQTKWDCHSALTASMYNGKEQDNSGEMKNSRHPCGYYHLHQLKVVVGWRQRRSLSLRRPSEIALWRMRIKPLRLREMKHLYVVYHTIVTKVEYCIQVEKYFHINFSYASKFGRILPKLKVDMVRANLYFCQIGSQTHIRNLASGNFWHSYSVSDFWQGKASLADSCQK